MADFDPVAWDVHQRSVADARKPYADKLMQVRALTEEWEKSAEKAYTEWDLTGQEDDDLYQAYCTYMECAAQLRRLIDA